MFLKFELTFLLKYDNINRCVLWQKPKKGDSMGRSALVVQDEAVKLFSLTEGDSFTFSSLQEFGDSLVRSYTGRRAQSWRPIVPKLVDLQFLSPQTDSTGVVEFFWNIDLRSEAETFRQKRQQELHELEANTPKYLLNFAVKLFLQFGDRELFSYKDMKAISRFSESFGVRLCSAPYYLHSLVKVAILNVQYGLQGRGRKNQYYWNALAIELLMQKAKELCERNSANETLSLESDDERRAFSWLGKVELVGDDHDRVVEFDFPSFDGDDDYRSELIEKLLHCSVLLTVGVGVRGRIFKVNRLAYQRMAEAISADQWTENDSDIDEMKIDPEGDDSPTVELSAENCQVKIERYEALLTALRVEKRAIEKLRKLSGRLQQCSRTVHERHQQREALEQFMVSAVNSSLNDIGDGQKMVEALEAERVALEKLAKVTAQMRQSLSKASRARDKRQALENQLTCK